MSHINTNNLGNYPENDIPERTRMPEAEDRYPEYDLSGSRFVSVEEEIETEEELFLCNCLDCEIQRKEEKE